LTRMWEVRAAPGRLEDLVAHVLTVAAPTAAVYRGAGGDGRVVVIDPTGVGLADVPAELVAHPPHSWDFEPVRPCL
jgi:hypothetical protein